MSATLSWVLCLRRRTSGDNKPTQSVRFQRAGTDRRVFDLMDKHKPLHLCIIGGDPLVRYRELDVPLPDLVKRAHIQVVTSAFRRIPLSWATLPNLQLVVSIDGLQPEHDLRRKPATYERILSNIQSQHIAVHC